MAKMSADTLWQRMLKELVLFQHREGHCEVPNKYNDNQSLGMWVSTQRQQYKLIKDGKKSPLSTDRIEALEFIGFTWQMQKPNNYVPWIERYEELKQFRIKKGHCKEPKR